MKALGIIPSRYQSTRFPGKPLIDIAGKTMIQRVYEQASKSALLNEVIVATDDQRIFDHVKSFGGNVMMTRVEHTNGTLRCGEVIETKTGYDVVINIQGDEPLVKPEQLDRLISLFQNPHTEIATVVKRLHDSSDIENENRIKVVLDHQQNAIYFSRSPIPFVQGKQLVHWPEFIPYFKHIGVYAWRTETLKKLLHLPSTALEKAESLEQLRWLYHGYKIATIETDSETPNIDTPEDVAAVIRALNENI